MSIRALNWALRDARVQRSVFDVARSVLIVLADHANDADEAWPSVPTLMRECGFGRTAVNNALAELEQLGAVESRGYRDRCRVRFLRMEDFDPAVSRPSHLPRK